MIITLDGPSASGKSTIARLLARRIEGSFLDTGAMYRAVTLAAMQAGVDIEDEQAVLKVLSKNKFDFSDLNERMVVRIDGMDVSKAIRRSEVTANARYIAGSAKVRKRLVQMQRRYASEAKNIVTEGRDQGTVVFPDADFKFYLTASIEERARRRRAELSTSGKKVSLQEIREAIQSRDESDQSRSVGPLKAADDAIVVDTTNSSINQVVDKLFGFLDSSHRETLMDTDKSAGSMADKNKKKKEPDRFMRKIWFEIARWVCRVFCMLFFDLRVYGQENIPKKGAFILISNHQSFLDPVFCGVDSPRHLSFLARVSLFSNRIFSKVLSSVNTIPVRRGEADLSAIRKVIKRLCAGEGVCLYPEGTRSIDGRIGELKGGFGLLSRRSGAAIIPTVVEGAFECWPKGKRFFSGGRVVVSYSEPIRAERVAGMDDKELVRLVTERLRELQSASRRREGREPFAY